MKSHQYTENPERIHRLSEVDGVSIHDDRLPTPRLLGHWLKTNAIQIGSDGIVRLTPKGARVALLGARR